jgi:hypothetical protein
MKNLKKLSSFLFLTILFCLPKIQAQCPEVPPVPNVMYNHEGYFIGESFGIHFPDFSPNKYITFYKSGDAQTSRIINYPILEFHDFKIDDAGIYNVMVHDLECKTVAFTTFEIRVKKDVQSCWQPNHPKVYFDTAGYELGDRVEISVDHQDNTEVAYYKKDYENSSSASSVSLDSLFVIENFQASDTGFYKVNLYNTDPKCATFSSTDFQLKFKSTDLISGVDLLISKNNLKDNILNSIDKELVGFSFELFDLSGQKVSSFTSGSVKDRVAQLKNGMYLYQLNKGNNKLEYGKLVIED